MSFLGIDLGTSFVKGAILNLDALQLEHVRRIPFSSRIKFTNPLFCEFDPAEVVRSVRQIIDALAPYVPDCEGVVLCSQMHGTVFMNEERTAVSNCISWMDHRGAMPHPTEPGSYLDVMKNRTSASQRRQLGNELRLERPACYLFWLSEQGRLDRPMMPVSLPDFVVSVLCGSVPVVDATNASATGLFNLESSDWHHEVMEDLGLGGLRMPTIRGEGNIAGHLHIGTRLVPCYSAVGDYQCALLGALLGPDELSMNIATGSQVSRMTTKLHLGDHQTRPFFEGTFLNTFTDAPGGVSLNVLVDLLTEFAGTNSNTIDRETPWAFIAQATAEISDTDLEVTLSFFDTPDSAGGYISNIRGNNLTAGHLFRAAFKEMARDYLTYAIRLWPERDWQNILFSGGVVCKSRALRETIERTLNAKSRLPPQPEDTLFGLMILASVFSGRAASIREVTEKLRADQCPEWVESSGREHEAPSILL